eukprot:1090884-Pelagomonas_calceolata.AAC.1
MKFIRGAAGFPSLPRLADPPGQNGPYGPPYGAPASLAVALPFHLLPSCCCEGRAAADAETGQGPSGVFLTTHTLSQGWVIREFGLNSTRIYV